MVLTISNTKAGYESNQSSVFTIASSTSYNTGDISLLRYDLNGDNEINILDLNIIGQHYGETTSKPYPVYDVNGDGIVTDLDIDIVRAHFGESFGTQPGSAP